MNNLKQTLEKGRAKFAELMVCADCYREALPILTTHQNEILEALAKDITDYWGEAPKGSLKARKLEDLISIINEAKEGK